jgi:hypothetical protein
MEREGGTTRTDATIRTHETGTSKFIVSPWQLRRFYLSNRSGLARPKLDALSQTALLLVIPSLFVLELPVPIPLSTYEGAVGSQRNNGF